MGLLIITIFILLLLNANLYLWLIVYGRKKDKKSGGCINRKYKVPETVLTEVGGHFCAILGKGGIATVYLVCGSSISGGKPMAVKVLSQQFCCDYELKERFFDEPTIMRVLERAQISPVIYGSSGPNALRPWFAMEYINGSVTMYERVHNLQATTRRRDKQQLASKLIKAVASMHDRGVIHRDLCPHNVLVPPSGSGYLRIIDFGGAKYRNRDFSREMFFHALTMPGFKIGKDRYSAPEVWDRGIGSAGYAADVYSLCIILWELFTGRVLLDSRTRTGVDEKRKAIGYQDRMPLVGGLNTEQSRIIYRGLRYREEERPDVKEIISLF